MKAHKESIDFCLMLGDLGEDGRKNQIDPLIQIFKGLDRAFITSSAKSHDPI